MTKPDAGKLRDALDAALDKYVKQQGRNTIALNAERDPACVGYARVPGPDACDFCVTMGAANDFYRTEGSAGGGELHGTADDHYHPYCNCQVCLVFRRGGKPGGDLVARDPQTGEAVPYDPADILRRYEEAGHPTFAKNRAREAVNKRGRKAGASGGSGGVRPPVSPPTGGGDLPSRYKTGREIQVDGVFGSEKSTYQVFYKGELVRQFVPESSIVDEVIFAGHCTSTEFRNAELLAEVYGGVPDRWFHSRGSAWLFDPGNGRIRNAEIHWCEEESVGIREIVFKSWLS